MSNEHPEQAAIVNGGGPVEPDTEPQALLVDLGNVRDLTLGAGGNQTKDGKYFYA